MRLNSLRLCNFRQHVDTFIAFENGLTGIIGANGSGKSTILEAIAWALYGMPAARGTRDSIVSHRAPARAAVKVELDFELGGHRYVVTRGLSHAEVYLDGGAAPIAASLSGVTDLLRRRLGMSREEFFNTYFTGQKELAVMAALGPADRGRFLSRVLGYERLRVAQDLIRKRASAVIAEATGLRAGMPDPDAVTRARDEATIRAHAGIDEATSAAEVRARARGALDEIAPRWEAIQRDRDLVQAIEADRRVAEGERSALLRDVARLDGELAQCATERTELDRLVVDLEPLSAALTDLAQLDGAAHEQARRQTLTDTAASIADDLTRLRARNTEILAALTVVATTTETLAEARAELGQVQRTLDDARSAWAAEKQGAETARAGLLRQLRDVERQRTQIAGLGADGVCPVCTQSLRSHLPEVLATLDAQAAAIVAEGTQYRASLDRLVATPLAIEVLDAQRTGIATAVSTLERRLAAAQTVGSELGRNVSDVANREGRQAAVARDLATIAASYDSARHAEVRRIVDRLAPVSVRAAALVARLEREPSLAGERDQMVVAAGVASARAAGLAARRAAVDFSDELFATTRERHDGCVAGLRAAELHAVAAEAACTAARAALVVVEEAVAGLAAAVARLADLVRERRLHDELDRAFTELRTELNQAVRPELAELASQYLRELTDGRYSEMELDEQYGIVVYEDATPKPVISGGEEDLANLVLRLAISEMIAERAGQSFSLLILDEVFGSLDETRRHNVIDLLGRLRGRFEQVMLITHIESVREGLDHVVTVRYDEESGYSTATASSADETLEAAA